MIVTTFPTVRATEAKAENITWLDLVDRCQNPPTYPSKTDCQLIKLATFGEQRTPRGSLRHDGNVLSVAGIEADYDAGELSPETAAALLQLAGIRSVIYTSPSHTPNAPRWRVMAPLSRDYAPHERREFVGRLNGALGGVLARESFTLSQTFYIGRVLGAPYETHVIDGTPVDLCNIAPIFPAAAPTRMHDADAVADLSEIESALRFIPADDYHEWIAVGQALSQLGEDGFRLWSEWSARSDKHDPGSDLWRWETFSAERTGFQAIFAKAQRNGWENPKARKPVDLSNLFNPHTGLQNYQIGLDVRDGTENTHPLTEVGNAWRLADAYGDRLLYVHDAKAWLHWLDGAWTWDIDEAGVRSVAARLSGQIYSEGRKHLHGCDVFAKWARESQKARTIVACVSLLKDVEHLRISTAQIDANPFLAGMDNGRQLIDLKTGMVRPTMQKDAITKALNVPEMGVSDKANRWITFLNQIFGNDAELIDWLQRWCGYLLTGSTKEQFFVFCFGLGANGKSVFADTIRYILGDYARAIAPESLTETKRQAGSATPEIADLIGARLALSAETEDGARLAESLVKSLVGGDTMTARKLYSAPIQFTPQFKLMMLGNHKPVIRGTDYGLWRRIRLIPFLRTFKESERDPELSEKLRAEAPHILAWMVEGCLKWDAQGLKDTPETIRMATADYRDEQDIIGQWIEERCSCGSPTETAGNELFESYKSWCASNGLNASNAKTFGRRLSERGFDRRRSNGRTIWIGIKPDTSKFFLPAVH
ncbi:phage/plasmid primase, P4 family [Methylomonas koyamae]|uniref:phage/plasmid primase, P4 family n=1 Tax=Methylomonas koyamae TaxID=702114 RepID=UPI00112AF370|nr:phage/plasmid primase, P4 family [Methylomonas koyamae]TPQ27632.1 hypothetical protein C2U68_07950 [Methylomonas koyamae]